MLKNYFHNNRKTNDSHEKKRLIQPSKVDTKSIVDINILLNRVKIEEKNQIKKKIIFFSLITLTLTLFGYFIVIIK